MTPETTYRIIEIMADHIDDLEDRLKIIENKCLEIEPKTKLSLFGKILECLSEVKRRNEGLD